MNQSEETIMASIVGDATTNAEIDAHEISRRCEVTYQTAKNFLDGRSTNARFLKRFVDEFGITNNPALLRRLLLGYLLVQFQEGDGMRMMADAGLLGEIVHS